MPEVTESPRGAMGKQMKAGGGAGGKNVFDRAL